MKTNLPEPAAYYRPTRACELRRKADRLGGLAVSSTLAAGTGGVSLLVGAGLAVLGYAELLPFILVLGTLAGGLLAHLVAQLVCCQASRPRQRLRR